MSDVQPQSYTVNCAIHGENTLFPVKIASSETVGILKEKIKEKKPNRFASVDADELALYRVDISGSRAEMMEELKKMPDDFGQREDLDPFCKLTNIYSTAPPEGIIHILVRPPQTASLKRRRNDSDGVEPRKRRRLGLLPQSLTVFKTEVDPERPDGRAHLPMQGGFHDMTSLYNLIAVDKTKYIELLDTNDKYSYMFLRPRRWGKSTFLQTLMDYYDKANKDRFYDIFRDLYIGKNPTKGRNSLLVLRFDFSEVSGASTPAAMREQFDRMINFELKNFLTRNQAFLGEPNLDLVDASDGTKSLKQVLMLVEEQGEKLFVGVDEYDAPANTVIFDDNDDRYQFVADFFKMSFFSIMKQAVFTVVDKYWITGVLPVFRDGISPLNASTIISDKPGYNGLCGLTDTEVREIAQSYLSPLYKEQQLEGVVEQLKRWYNGYLFCREKDESTVDSLYNPQLVFNHLRGLANDEVRLTPLEEINAVHISSVLAAIPDTGEASFFRSYLSIIADKLKMKVAHQFGASQVRQRGEDASITWNLLYFFGVLTHAEDGNFLKVPNMTMTNVITLRLSKFLNKQTHLTPKSTAAYNGLLNEKAKPLAELLEDFFGKEPARAVKDCNEAALRTALAVFWSDDGCLTELSLLVDPRAQSGHRRSAFLDLFLPTTPSAPCIELKNIPLEALWRGQHGTTDLRSDLPLETLREELRQETEDQLLERKVIYGKEKKLVKDVKREASEQIARYLEAMKNGMATTDFPGVHDRRVQQREGECALVGYAVILLGGTRALGWHVKTERINFTLHVKAEIQEDSLIL